MDKMRYVIITGLIFILAGCANLTSGQGGATFPHQPYRGAGEGPLYGPAANIVFGPIIQTRIAYMMNAEDLAQMDDANKIAHLATKGQVIPWSNPKTGYAGAVEVLNDGYSDTGGYCREYLQTLRNNRGHAEKAIGVFCQDAGEWKIEYL